MRLLLSSEQTEVPVDIAWLTLTKSMMLASVIFVANASFCFVWLRQTSIKDVITLNVAFIVHPLCPTSGLHLFL